ncbi:hypothetical protein PILCRDRAFT_15711 [Piloderma croceum F 1598]|uniref:Uncharacterized protein n=1 Tax=Piloderma croceum (strain F 1598) TaxID=765440 RepID=A0A0C3EY58_PILCF|nr:hypothetical protein PILCRDRAFT_15711 [Piloderma croceum F 1598]
MLELQPPTFLRTIIARSPMPLELVQPLTARLVRDAGQIVAANADNDNGRTLIVKIQRCPGTILSSPHHQFAYAPVDKRNEPIHLCTSPPTCTANNIRSLGDGVSSSIFWSAVSLSGPLSSRSSHLTSEGRFYLALASRYVAMLIVSAVTCLVPALQWGGNAKAWNDKSVIISRSFAGVIGVALVACEKYLGDNAMVLLTIFT